jgi:hypothetical protein
MIAPSTFAHLQSERNHPQPVRGQTPLLITFPWARLATTFLLVALIGIGKAC